MTYPKHHAVPTSGEGSCYCVVIRQLTFELLLTSLVGESSGGGLTLGQSGADAGHKTFTWICLPRVCLPNDPS
jgi:hypothetical protein